MKNLPDLVCLVESGRPASDDSSSSPRLLGLARGGGRPSSLLASGFDLITSSQHGDSVRVFLALAVILFLSLLLPIRSRTVLFNFLHAAVTCDSSNTLSQNPNRA